MKKWLKKNLYRLPPFRQLDSLAHAATIANVIQINQFFQQQLLFSPKYRDARKLNHYELQVFSQNGEDGIIAEIFKRIGTNSLSYVELGVGDGLENNTVFLLTQGWHGYWVEGDKSLTERIQNQFHPYLLSGRLKLKQALVTRENVENLLAEMEVAPEFDLLSVDLDRNTSHIWKAIKNFRPRVAVIEYNAALPPSIEWEVEYAARQMWNGSVHFGASLKSLEKTGKALGYVLVGCDFSGTNAFFVREDQKLELFASPFTAEIHHEPPRYWSLRREAHCRGLSDI